ncbi:hypothetical protein Mal15_13160 [Stieleria maiorica]|uniref:Uncharacterized protein n=1 Tax=Stieleria maiorica TaxID=2795974 RepID=A0A5B9MDF1_9BACT|nr:hypothetical protein [Stieleria maiorica]QEF97277.1 hypothetical protein Mal15_13160 [Stieleria maiorica]
MRIPSQFNDSSLYRPRRGDGNSKKHRSVPGATDSRRRLIRLGVVLLLVVVVMREARRPGLYQTFFDTREENWIPIAPAADPTGRSAQTGAPADRIAAAGNDVTVNARAGESGAAIRRATARWVDAMEVPLQRAWTESLIKIQSSSAQTSTGWGGLSVDQFDASTELVQQSSVQQGHETHDEFLAMIQTLRDCAVADECPPGVWGRIASVAVPTLDALQAAATRRVSDGTFWTSADSDAFYLGLVRSDALPSDGGVTTGTLPLLQQPEIYRGQTIRLVGTLHLAEPKTAQSNRAGVESYWKLWIIPADGGIRPTILMTRELPGLIADSLTADGKWDHQSNPDNPDGKIAAVGRFIKRLPYRSSIGADLAPVVIGRVVGAKGLASTSGEQSGGDATGDSAAAGGDLTGLVGVLLAIVGGIALAGFLMYRSALDAKRSRTLRQHAGDDVKLDLDALADHDAANEGTQS